MRGLLANEQRNLMSARNEEIGQLCTQPARGKIREPTDIVHRFVSRPRSDDTVHVGVQALACWASREQAKAWTRGGIDHAQMSRHELLEGALGLAGGVFPHQRHVVGHRLPIHGRPTGKGTDYFQFVSCHGRKG